MDNKGMPVKVLPVLGNHNVKQTTRRPSTPPLRPYKKNPMDEFLHDTVIVNDSVTEKFNQVKESLMSQ
jgi:hypothetical protein